MKVILNSVPYDGRSTHLDFVPDHEIVISGAEELANMKADRIREGKFTL